MSVHTTACPRNCYSTCGMRVHVEDGAIRRIEPHPGNRATPEGVCLAGEALGRAGFYGRLRIQSPALQMKTDLSRRLASSAT